MKSLTSVPRNTLYMAKGNQKLGPLGNTDITTGSWAQTRTRDARSEQGLSGSGKPAPSSISTDSNVVIPISARTPWAGGGWPRKSPPPPSEEKSKDKGERDPTQGVYGRGGGLPPKQGLRYSLRKMRGPVQSPSPSTRGRSQETGHQPVNPTSS